MIDLLTPDLLSTLSALAVGFFTSTQEATTAIADKQATLLRETIQRLRGQREMQLKNLGVLSQRAEGQLKLQPIYDRLAKQILDSADTSLAQEKKLTEDWLARLERGGTASPEEQARIGSLYGDAETSGLGRMANFRTAQAGSLAKETAPTLRAGLGAGYTPDDRLNIVARTAEKTQGDLVNALRLGRSQAELSYPLQVMGALGPAVAQQQGLGQSRVQTGLGLAEQAQANRMALNQAFNTTAASLVNARPGSMDLYANQLQQQLGMTGADLRNRQVDLGYLGSIIGGLGSLGLGLANVRAGQPVRSLYQ